MENITLNEILDILKFLAALITSSATIYGVIKMLLKKQLTPIYRAIQIMDANQCKNFLVRSLADIERGVKLDDVEIQRMYDAYDHYCKDLNGNSYIHDKWEKLMGGERKWK